MSGGAAWSIGHGVAADELRDRLEDDPAAALRPGRFDAMLRRRSQRSQRERGCWVYVPAEELLKAGVDLSGPPPFYRVWGSRGGSVLVRLYKEA